MPAVATRPATIQICDLEPNKRFTFTTDTDGDGSRITEYVKIGNKHYRKAAAENGVCCPILSLPRAIRTIVQPS
jgi:hypothetical protein